jgi:hypothetical protein
MRPRGAEIGWVAVGGSFEGQPVGVGAFVGQTATQILVQRVTRCG